MSIVLCVCLTSAAVREFSTPDFHLPALKEVSCTREFLFAASIMQAHCRYHSTREGCAVAQAVSAAHYRKTPWPESASELNRPSDSRSSAKLAQIFAHRGCQEVSVTNPYKISISFVPLCPSLYCKRLVKLSLYSLGLCVKLV
jgi:hypothetical protein